MNEDYEERLNELKGRFDALKNKIAHCENFLTKCDVQIGVKDIVRSADKSECEIHYIGADEEEKIVAIRLLESSDAGIVSISSEEKDRNCQYTITYKTKDKTEQTLDFVLKHGDDSTGKDGSDPYTEYYDNGNVKVSKGPPVEYSAKETGFSASVTGMSVSATGMSVSLKGVSLFGCGIYNSNTLVSSVVTGNKVKVEPAKTKVTGQQDHIIQDEDKNIIVDNEIKTINNEIEGSIVSQASLENDVPNPANISNVTSPSHIQ